MTNPVQVVARFKGGDPLNPRFTKTSTVEELFKAVKEALPVDKVFYILPHADGLGYHLREVGEMTVDILQLDMSAKEVDSSPASPLAPSPQVESEPDTETLPENVINDLQSIISAQPMVPPSPPSEDGSFTGFAPIKPPPSQDSLAGLPAPAPMKPARKTSGRKKKMTPAEMAMQDDGPIDSDVGLPSAPNHTPVSRKVTHISEATPEQAAKASRFGAGIGR